eukprot:12683749-Alexandrium_andersonii.AAC.1
MSSTLSALARLRVQLCTTRSRPQSPVSETRRPMSRAPAAARPNRTACMPFARACASELIRAPREVLPNSRRAPPTWAPRGAAR